jgi:hypothetical protein
MNESQLGVLSRTYEKIAPHWPGIVAREARERLEPPAPTGKPAFWFAKERSPWSRISAEIEAEVAP